MKTNLEGGLEYLPISIQQFDYDKESRIGEQLKPFGGKLELWQETHTKLLVKTWLENIKTKLNTHEQMFPLQLLKEKEELQSKLVKYQKTSQGIISQLKKENIDLQEKLLAQQKKMEALEQRNLIYEQHFQKQKSDHLELEVQLISPRIQESQLEFKIEVPPKTDL